jgi:hypothetical protein
MNSKTKSFEREFKRMRPVVRERSGGRCEARLEGCTGRGQTVRHRQRRTQGGDNSLANLLDACAACHDRIHAWPAESYLCGFLVHEWDDPARIEVSPRRARELGLLR